MEFYYITSYLEGWRQVEVLVDGEGQLVVDVVDQLEPLGPDEPHRVGHRHFMERVAAEHASDVGGCRNSFWNGEVVDFINNRSSGALMLNLVQLGHTL